MLSRKYLAGLIPGILVSFSLLAQDEDGIRFNERQQNGIRSSLDSRYHGVDPGDVQWQLNSQGYFDGSFDYNNRSLTATFDQDGVWRQTSEEIQMTDLSDDLKTSLDTTYREEEIRQINRIETSDNETFYDFSFHGREPVRYDVLGNRVEEDGY